MSPEELTGQVRTHIVDVPEPQCALHVHVAAPFLSMRRAAGREGFDLAPVSSFRSFDRQLAIWNAKWSGAKPLYDAAGSALDATAMAPEDRVTAILNWSALPGASRHHWGSDLDLIDRRAAGPGYRPQLIVAEFIPPGPYAEISMWLERNASRFGFFRPFRGVRSGVQAEPWHLSFAPIADQALRRLGVGVLRAALAAAPLLGKEQVLARLEELHARYVASVDQP